ncbi:acetyl-CoA C-acyltransferase [Paenibacillus flagellatus]|uniref:acetyl-CoA C-acyltransferase n=1 Tax=Paenibacillus flagellatus TaxID=2211139 RepID=A0A2V5L002_9BACL|nr:acetyl-CoA C-acyltransferase [Paenibacillus flagellatus]PYI55846.1 acetyl-CoA C-acyltransferase [Paenibacillus flagellatus]
MEEAVIVTAVRTAVGRGRKGSLAQTRAEDLGRTALEAAVDRTPGLRKEDVEDIVIGCAMPEGEQGLNFARTMALYAGFPVSVPAITVNRFCSSGLQAIAYAAERIMLGRADTVIAGGVESMSHVPMTGFKLSPHPDLLERMPEAYMGMGHTAERVAQRYGITREEQDAFAYASHKKAAAAQAAGKFADEIAPVRTTVSGFDADRGAWTKELVFDVDECVRPDTTPEALAKLKPAFSANGTVTAGNASPVSDGAAALVVMSRRKAESLGLKPLAAYRSFAVAGVPPEVMGIGPVEAIPKALRQAGIGKGDVSLYEINEAFASQCIQVIRQLELDDAAVNPNGGAIALGHPLGCTGAKLATTLIRELGRRGGGYGVVSMCIGGGMGAAGVFEAFAP